MDNKKQINVRLEQELYDFLGIYAKSNYKTVTAVLKELITQLYKESKNPPLIINPRNK